MLRIEVCANTEECRYLGTLPNIGKKDYLTALSSILSVEARHTSYLRAAIGETPFANPFDTPLDFVRTISRQW